MIPETERGAPPEREPTADEMLTMAYADGELDPATRRAFAARLEREPALAREVAALRRLDVLARHAAGPEPIDHEWRRIARSPARRAGLALAWSLLVAGALGLSGSLLFALLGPGLALAPKLALAALAAGAVLLVLLTLRARARTLAYDVYREVER